MQIWLAEACLAAGPTLEWVRQFGTPLSNSAGIDGEQAGGLALDSQGNIFLTGESWGNLGGVNGGRQDVYLKKYNPVGNELWTRQFGGDGNDRGYGVSVDGLGNAFVTGFYDGSFISKFDPEGNEIWREQRGGYDASEDGRGNVYVSGVIDHPETENDALVTKFDAAGNELWSTQFGGSFWDLNTRISADNSGNVFAFGEIQGNGAFRAFLTKLDSDGNEYWTREVRAARYVQRGDVLADGLGNVYIAGSANAPIEVPRVHQGYDAFLAKYDSEGNRLWIREFGTPEYADRARGIALDVAGNLLVTGNMGGPYLAKFDTNGNQLWMHSFGSPETASAGYVSATDGNVYIAGTTRQDFGGVYSGGGGDDVFLVKFRDDSIPALPPGDFNQDGTVDAADFVAWRKSGGTSEDYDAWRTGYDSPSAASPAMPGDINADGSVDAADFVAWRKTGGTPEQYNQWRAAFGLTAAAAANSILPSAPSVPEPASLMLLTIAAFGIGARHRKPR